MISFVTWPPLQLMMVQKGGQVTKPIIVVKMPRKVLYVYHLSEKILNKTRAETATKKWGAQLPMLTEEPTFMRAQNMPNLFGHAHIHYFQSANT